MMDQVWFEMTSVRRRKTSEKVWIPLRAIQHIEEVGEYGQVGYRSDFYGVASVAFREKHRKKAEKLGWEDVGLDGHHRGCIENNKYIPSDIFVHYTDEITGLYLVLHQFFNSDDEPEWHLHQDFIITLGLKRELDRWVRPEEDYIEVARLSRGQDGRPCLLEVRASHLKDYLCARGMALYLSSYRGREEVVEDTGKITWETNSCRQTTKSSRWEGQINEIHQGGMPFGAETFMLHVGRSDVDAEEDVPTIDLPTDENVVVNSHTKKDHGKKLYFISGRLWRTEWVEPATKSPIVRGDKIPMTVSFIVDAEGNRKSCEQLVDGGRWLWFNPGVIAVLADRRGGSLKWHTRDTGHVSCSPDYDVDFGVNSIGIITVYAKDVCRLPEWQQKIWAGFNINPEGGVSEELLEMQAAGNSVNTQAPEDYLAKGLSFIQKFSEKNLGFPVLRAHQEVPTLIDKIHRFRATDKAGLFALAKDLNRVSVETIDEKAIKKYLNDPNNKGLKSLKLMQTLLESKLSADHARAIMGPFVGIYELRHADAHLPASDYADSLKLVRVDPNKPYVVQGYMMLHSCAISLQDLCVAFNRWRN